MDHDYEIASFDRTTAHVFDKVKLSKEVRYWQSIAPTTAAEEEAARGGYDHTDVQKARKKAGLPASRPGPVTERAPEPEPVVVAAAAPVAAEPVAKTEPTAAASVAAPPPPVPPSGAGGETPPFPGWVKRGKRWVDPNAKVEPVRRKGTGE
jgi:hypothetical protein